MRHEKELVDWKVIKKQMSPGENHSVVTQHCFVWGLTKDRGNRTITRASFMF